MAKLLFMKSTIKYYPAVRNSKTNDTFYLTSKIVIIAIRTAFNNISV